MAKTGNSVPTQSSSSALVVRGPAGQRVLPANTEDSTRLAGEIMPPSEPGSPERRDVSRKSRPATLRWPARYPGCVEALKMLTLRPVLATPLPRHHVEPRAVDGSRLVHDRATSERFVVYSPRFVEEFRAGHRAGLWYLRTTNDLGTIPQSMGFTTAGGTVNALRAGVWRVWRARIRNSTALASLSGSGGHERTRAQKSPWLTTGTFYERKNIHDSRWRFGSQAHDRKRAS